MCLHSSSRYKPGLFVAGGQPLHACDIIIETTTLEWVGECYSLLHTKWLDDSNSVIDCLTTNISSFHWTWVLDSEENIICWNNWMPVRKSSFYGILDRTHTKFPSIKAKSLRNSWWMNCLPVLQFNITDPGSTGKCGGFIHARNAS